jgi:hypothetical protein
LAFVVWIVWAFWDLLQMVGGLEVDQSVLNLPQTSSAHAKNSQRRERVPTIQAQGDGERPLGLSDHTRKPVGFYL